MKTIVKITLVSGETITSQLEVNFPYSLSWGVPEWLWAEEGFYFPKSAILKVHPPT